MKSILARLFLRIFPATILLIVAGLWLTHQLGRLSPFIVNLNDPDRSQGGIFAWDIEANRVRPVALYDQNFVGASAGWSWPVFSDDGRWVAYVRYDGGRQWIGISDSIRWKPREYLATVPLLARHTRLTWLPSSGGLLVSYTVDKWDADFETLVGRQRLDLDGAELVDWPFVCDRLMLGDGQGGLMLRCAFRRDLRQSSTPFMPAVLYQLASGQWLTDSATPTRELFPLDDVLHPNWSFSPQSGIAFFGTFFDGAPGGLNRVALDSDQSIRLPFDLTRQPRLLWSPDGSRLLVQQTDSRVWSVFDLAQNRAIARLSGADIDVNVGYSWFHDSNHVAYVVLPSDQEPRETLHVRALDRDEDMTVLIRDRLTDIVWMHP